MRTILYPGSFDPVTEGHMDIIRRASSLFERLIVGILHNPQKPGGAFSIMERLKLLETATSSLPNVSVEAMTGLLVDAARACKADAVLRGIRSAAETESELQMARLNHHLAGIETLFMAASPAAIHISASYVREIGRLGGSLQGLVPEAVRPEIARTLAQNK